MARHAIRELIVLCDRHGTSLRVACAWTTGHTRLGWLARLLQRTFACVHSEESRVACDSEVESGTMICVPL
jgi:hypothetical protein